MRFFFFFFSIIPFCLFSWRADPSWRITTPRVGCHAVGLVQLRTVHCLCTCKLWPNSASSSKVKCKKKYPTSSNHIDVSHSSPPPSLIVSCLIFWYALQTIVLHIWGFPVTSRHNPLLCCWCIISLSQSSWVDSTAAHSLSSFFFLSFFLFFF